MTAFDLSGTGKIQQLTHSAGGTDELPPTRRDDTLVETLAIEMDFAQLPTTLLPSDTVVEDIFPDL